jgi:hypothetical protein
VKKIIGSCREERTPGQRVLERAECRIGRSARLPTSSRPSKVSSIGSKQNVWRRRGARKAGSSRSSRTHAKVSTSSVVRNVALGCLILPEGGKGLVG